MNRTKKAKQNIAASIVLKVIDTIAYLLIIPVTIGYLNSYEYGIWLTINSILTWIYSFDIGLGSGLRNKLAIAIAANDDNLGRKYVSTTFFSLVVLMIFIALVGFIICSNIGVICYFLYNFRFEFYRKCLSSSTITCSYKWHRCLEPCAIFSRYIYIIQIDRG